MAIEDFDILLVEDDPADIELTLRALRGEQIANRIHIARDGADALDFLFRREKYAGREDTSYPRLILLDLKLPKVDGIEVLRAIKADPRTRTIPTVVLTSSAEECDLVSSYKLGVNSYIQKPVDFDKFRNTVKQIGLYWLVINQAPPREEPPK